MQTATGVRHQVNEDALGHQPRQGLWLVADGMGGHAAGDVASHIVKDTVLNESRRGVPLGDTLRSAHRAVLRAAHKNPDNKGMGSTIVAVRLNRRHADVAWVGDSRAYLLRDGALAQITTDHSFVQHLLDSGEITPAEAERHPEKNVLIRTLGFEDPEPAETLLELRDGDQLLLCSDGVTGVLTVTEIEAALTSATTPQDAANALVNAVVSRQGKDDASAIVIRYTIDSDISSILSSAMSSVVNYAKNSAIWPVFIGVAAGLLVFVLLLWIKSG